jgi:hypothetical protein
MPRLCSSSCASAALPRSTAPLVFTGLVTLIDMYHYFRIFQSFENAYTPCMAVVNSDGNTVINYNISNAAKFGYTETGHPFNDAYRCE